MAQLFIITKPIITNASGRVEPAQCLLDSDDWELVSYDLDTKQVLNVYSGFYEHCKKLQTKLSDGKDVRKDIKTFQNESENMRKKNQSFVSKISERLKRK